MASNVTVELEGEPTKRVSVKTTPAMSLKAIATTACEKLKLSQPDAFGLRYQKALLDLSLSVRFANLPAGAKLLLVKQGTRSISSDESKAHSASDHAAPVDIKVQDVNIALQVDDGTRLVKKFASSMTLWGVLKNFEEQDR
jgi:tether containing UBX domain for GLUT4